jgi:hypothetical protein
MSSLAQKVKAAASVIGIIINLNSSDDEGAVFRAMKAIDTDARKRIEKQLEVSGDASAAAEIRRNL